MPTVLPPARTELSNTPSQSNAVAKAGLGKQWDWLTNLFGTTGTTAGALTTLGAVAKAGDTLTGALNEAHGTDIASAATINLTTATGNLVDVTGTVAITAITLADGAERTVRFTGILTLTNGASLILPGGANITTEAGAFAVFRGYAAGVVRCVDYTAATTASARAIIGAAALAGLSSQQFSVANATTSAHAVALGQFSNTLGAALSAALPGGLVLKAGTAPSIAAGATGTIVFPVAFPTSCVAVVFSEITNTSTAASHSVVSAVSASQFSWLNASAGATAMYWIAIGF